MKKMIAASLFVAATLVLPQTGMAGDAAAGKAIYDKKCKSCHGADGSGNAAMEKMLKVTIKPLGSAEIQAKSDADLIKDMIEGFGKMKPVKDLSAGDAANVVAHVRTLKQ